MMWARLRFGSAAMSGLGLAVALGAACGGGAEPERETGAQAIVTRAGPSAAASPGNSTGAYAAVMDQNDLKFIPTRLTVKVGDGVLLKNSETSIHTVNLNGKNVTGNMKKGDTTIWTATVAGEYKVTCDYHPQMKATIVVTP